MREVWRMLRSWIRGEPDRHASDPVKDDLERRQLVVIRNLSRLTGRTPRDLLDYERADRMLRRR